MNIHMHMHIHTGGLRFANAHCRNRFAHHKMEGNMFQDNSG